MYSTKQNVAVVQVKRGRKRYQVSPMANPHVNMWTYHFTHPKIHNHIGASRLKSERHGTSLFHCTWLHRDHHKKEEKRLFFCLKPWFINKAYDVKAFEFMFQNYWQSKQSYWNVLKMIIWFLKLLSSPVDGWVIVQITECFRQTQGLQKLARWNNTICCIYMIYLKLVP